MTSSLLPADWLTRPLSEIARLAPLESVPWSPLAKRGVLLSVKREDLLGDQLGGNKVYKLYGHLHKARTDMGEDLKLASFGGAWSNHLYALGAAGQQLGIPVLAVVRGEESVSPSLMLQDLQRMGVQIAYVSRAKYREYKQWALSRSFRKLDALFGKYYWIPEGGGGREGANSCAVLRDAIIAMSERPVDVIAHACGTGTSVAGLIGGANAKLSVLGVAVLKAGDAIAEEVCSLLKESGARSSALWEINKQSHCGGYAKLPQYLVDFMQRFEGETGVLLDPIYTAKLMYGLTQLAEAGKWHSNTHIVAIHSGGLQGRRGWPCLQ